MLRNITNLPLEIESRGASDEEAARSVCSRISGFFDFSCFVFFVPLEFHLANNRNTDTNSCESDWLVWTSYASNDNGVWTNYGIYKDSSNRSRILKRTSSPISSHEMENWSRNWKRCACLWRE